MAVAAFYGGGKLPKLGGVREDFDACLQRAVTAHVAQVTRNNGVREHNITAMLLPAGMLDGELDPLWLTSLDNFGQSRGDVAHQSHRTQTPPDPVTEKRTVQSLVAGLRSVDARLVQLRI